jgi:hypothetical protein
MNAQKPKMPEQKQMFGSEAALWNTASPQPPT